MEITIIIIIFTAVSMYIALPFFIKKGSYTDEDRPSQNYRAADPVVEKLTALENQKENLYSALRDIEFDHGLGKLSNDDYLELKNRYKSEAASVLKEIDDIQKQIVSGDIEAEIEKEILAYRKTDDLGSGADQEIEKEIQAYRNARKKIQEPGCAQCGAPYSAGDIFCSKCGVKLLHHEIA